MGGDMCGVYLMWRIFKVKSMEVCDVRVLAHSRKCLIDCSRVSVVNILVYKNNGIS